MATKHVTVFTYSGKEVDLEIPTNISADDLIHALHQSLEPSRPCPDYIRCDNPVALLHGNAKVEDFALRDGSTLYLI